RGDGPVDSPSFLKAADRGESPPVALLHGPDAFLLEDAAARVERGLFRDTRDLSLARETFDARSTGGESIVQSALMLPWQGDRRLVIARGVEGLVAKAGEALAAYVRSPNPSTVLLLLASPTLPASHWLMSAVPQASIVPILPPSGRQLGAWLVTR